MKVKKIDVAISLNQGELNIHFQDADYGFRSIGFSVPLNNPSGTLHVMAEIYGYNFPASLMIGTAAPKAKDAKEVYNNPNLTLGKVSFMVDKFVRENIIDEKI